MKFDNTCAGCFAGLSCGQRIEIINLLSKKKRMNVTEVARHFKLSQPTITHHLKYLKEMGLISSQKEGRKVFYSIDPKCAEACQIFA